jgi:hypothetical protein
LVTGGFASWCWSALKPVSGSKPSYQNAHLTSRIVVVYPFNWMLGSWLEAGFWPSANPTTKELPPMPKATLHTVQKVVTPSIPS